MSAVLNVEIKITISYRGIDLNLKNKILDQGIRMCFEKNNSMILKRGNPNVFLDDNESNKSVLFVIRRFVKTRMDCPTIRWTPFETITCKIILSLNRIKINVDKIMKDFEKRFKQTKDSALKKSIESIEKYNSGQI